MARLGYIGKTNSVPVAVQIGCPSTGVLGGSRPRIGYGAGSTVAVNVSTISRQGRSTPASRGSRKPAVDLYTGGSNLEAIGRVLGVKSGTVYSWVKKPDFPAPPHSYKNAQARCRNLWCIRHASRPDKTSITNQPRPPGENPSADWSGKVSSSKGNGVGSGIGVCPPDISSQASTSSLGRGVWVGVASGVNVACCGASTGVGIGIIPHMPHTGVEFSTDPVAGLVSR